MTTTKPSPRHPPLLLWLLLLCLLASGGALAQAQTTDPCRYDIIPDGTINATDMQTLSRAWDTPAYDFDADGRTDLDDVMLLSLHWGQTCQAHIATPTVTITPDPRRLNVAGLSSFWGDWGWQYGYAWCADDNTRTGCRSLQEATSLAQAQGYDFLDLAEDTRYMDTPAGVGWAEIQQEADRVTVPGSFVVFRAYEATGAQPSYNHEGHLIIYGLEHYTKEPTSMILGFYPWLARRPEPAFAMINHPRRDLNCQPDDNSCVDWELNDFEYHPEVDDRIELIQLDPAFNTKLDDSTYVRALEANWHIGASGSGYARQPLLDIGNRTYGVFATALTRQAILDGMRARRTFGISRNGNTAIAFMANDTLMGASVPATDTVSTWVRFKDTEGRSVARLEVIEGGSCGARVAATSSQPGSNLTWEAAVPRQGAWYYARALDEQGRLVAWSSPVWTTRQAAQPGHFTPRQALAVRSLNALYPQAVSTQAMIRSDTNRTLIQFDLSDLPTDQQVRGALLSLRTTGRDDRLRNLWITAYQMTRPWDPAVVNWERAATGQPWGAPGAAGPTDHNPLPEDITRTQKAESIYGLSGNRFYWDLTDLVQRWVSNPAANHGLLLVGCGQDGALIRQMFDEATLWLDLAD
jgi:hypothetical protein